MLNNRTEQLLLLEVNEDVSTALAQSWRKQAIIQRLPEHFSPFDINT